MTLGEMAVAAAAQPAEVRARSRRGIVRRMYRLAVMQRERDARDLGWRDSDDAPHQPLVGYGDLGGEA